VVDFDDSIELRKKYGVTVQHTFVQIDSSGGAIGKWSGSVTIAEVKSQLA
jgi:thioredoxin 1